MMQTDANERIADVSRGNSTSWRPLAVWLGVSAATATAGAAAPDAWRAAARPTGADAVADLVVAGCTVALAVALTWLWVVSTVTVAELASGRIRPGAGTTRRLVLLACGAVVVVGAGAPAVAAGAGAGEGSELLAGLALPERAVAPRTHRSRPAPFVPARAGGTDAYVVRPGDSLWSIAKAHPAGDSTDERWRAIWMANRDVVGADPDLIHPGQALRLPDPHTDPHTDPHIEKDGDRS
jgi:nucleoid-associated protein YgaU